MSHEDIIRAWKDEDYRMSLSEEERAKLPEHPAGLIELTDEELGFIGGGYDGGVGSTVTVNSQICWSSGCACITAVGCPDPEPSSGVSSCVGYPNPDGTYCV